MRKHNVFYSLFFYYFFFELQLLRDYPFLRDEEEYGVEKTETHLLNFLHQKKLFDIINSYKSSRKHLLRSFFKPTDLYHRTWLGFQSQRVTLLESHNDKTPLPFPSMTPLNTGRRITTGGELQSLVQELYQHLS